MFFPHPHDVITSHLRAGRATRRGMGRAIGRGIGRGIGRAIGRARGSRWGEVKERRERIRSGEGNLNTYVE